MTMTGIYNKVRWVELETLLFHATLILIFETCFVTVAVVVIVVVVDRHSSEEVELTNCNEMKYGLAQVEIMLNILPYCFFKF